MPAFERYAFAEFTLDATERRLSRVGRPISLEPKTHDVLVALVRHAGRLVTKRELLDLVWPESFVGDGILTVHISTLRKALGEGAHGREYIETVPRSGYRFVGAVTKQEPNRDDASERRSLAVLPARPLTTEILSERDRNLGLAISDVLIDRLGAITQLVVRPARAVHTYTRGGEDPAVVGRSLRVDAVIDCFFIRTGNRLELSVRLLRSQDGSVAWSTRFDQPVADVSAIADAIEWANRTLELDPRHPHAREHLAAAYLNKGETDRWMAENMRHAELHGAPPEALEPLKRAYAEGGRAGVVAFVLDHAAKLENPSAIMLAVHHGEAGNLDAAFEQLRRALDSRDPALVHLAVAPQWDSLRTDPRFNQCLARMGLTS